MSEFKVGDRVRVKDSEPRAAVKGEEFVITKLSTTMPGALGQPYAMGNQNGMGVYLEHLEQVIPQEIDKTPYPAYGGWSDDIHIGRNAGNGVQWYGNDREHEHGVFIKTNGAHGISTVQAREIAKYLTDLADRIESDQAIRKQQAAQAKADKKAELKAKIKELKANVADLERQVEED
jgi:hypothetical protein